MECNCTFIVCILWKNYNIFIDNKRSYYNLLSRTKILISNCDNILTKIKSSAPKQKLGDEISLKLQFHKVGSVSKEMLSVLARLH